MQTLPPALNTIQPQQVYADLNQLNSIRQDGKEDKSLALKQIAQQFEAMFLQMMMKSMRSANDVFAKDNPLNSFEMGFRQDMSDNQMTVSLSQDGGVGIADAFYRQLSRQFIKTEKSDVDTSFNEDFLRNNLNPYSESPDIITERISDAKQINQLETSEDFIELVTPHAKKVAEALGTDYRYLIAQTALETGWGKHLIRTQSGDHSFNLFNIKADQRWEGASVAVSTVEFKDGVAEKELANFRRYSSISDSFEDYRNFLQQPRYEKAIAIAEEPEQFIKALQSAGYATDPQYAKKIQDIVAQHFPEQSLSSGQKVMGDVALAPNQWGDL